MIIAEYNYIVNCDTCGNTERHDDCYEDEYTTNEDLEGKTEFLLYTTEDDEDLQFCDQNCLNTYLEENQ